MHTSPNCTLHKFLLLTIELSWHFSCFNEGLSLKTSAHIKNGDDHNCSFLSWYNRTYFITLRYGTVGKTIAFQGPKPRLVDVFIVFSAKVDLAFHHYEARKVRPGISCYLMCDKLVYFSGGTKHSCLLNIT